jgi:HEAT repeat protein
MSSEPSTEPTSSVKSSRLLWLCFGLLALVAAVCLLAIRPYIQVRWQLEAFENHQTSVDEVVAELGGQRAAAWKLGFYGQLPDRYAPHQWKVPFMLGYCGPTALPYLVPRLRDKDAYYQKEAIQALETIGGSEAVEQLIALIDDTKGDVQREVIEALGRMEDPRAVEPILTTLKAPDEETYDTAARALIRLHSERALDPLAAMVKGSDETLRTWAAYVLGCLGDSRAVDTLLVSLASPQDPIRADAAYALGFTKDSRAVAPLLAALGDKASRVRGCAALALGHMKERRAVEPLIAMLEAALKNDSDDAGHAGRALGELGDPRAIPALEALNKSHSLSYYFGDEAIKKVREAQAGQQSRNPR